MHRVDLISKIAKAFGVKGPLDIETQNELNRILDQNYQSIRRKTLVRRSLVDKDFLLSKIVYWQDMGDEYQPLVNELKVLLNQEKRRINSIK